MKSESSLVDLLDLPGVLLSFTEFYQGFWWIYQICSEFY